MKVEVKHSGKNFKSFRAEKVKSLFNAESGHQWQHTANLPIDGDDWQIRMRDVITGGTVFWLNSGIDRGDIAYQDWCFIEPRFFAMPPKAAARELWQNELQAMGLKLLETAVKDILRGVIIKRPQDAALSTFEPNTDVKDVFKPDLLMLEANASPSTSWHR